MGKSPPFRQPHFIPGEGKEYCKVGGFYLPFKYSPKGHLMNVRERNLNYDDELHQNLLHFLVLCPHCADASTLVFQVAHVAKISAKAT